MRYLVAISVVFALALGGAASALAETIPGLERALDEWALSKHVGISPALRATLARDAETAVQHVHKENPNVPLVRLRELAPKAVVSYLDKTQTDKDVQISIAALLDDLVNPKLSQDATAIGKFNVYPILTIEVTPPAPADFVVVIDGWTNRAGLKVFRVPAGDRSVQVTRASRRPCVNSIKVTPEGPNLLACAM
jgi:hypothetical protein